MTARSLGEWIVIGGLVGLCALFIGAATAFLQFDSTHEFASRRPADTNESGTPPEAGQAAEIPPLRAFSSLVERPLFVATRRPLSVAAPVSPSAAGEKLLLGKFKYSGVVITGTEKFVYLIAPGANQLLKVQQGTMLEGWRIKEITRDRILLSSEQGEREFIFSEDAK